MGDQRCPIWSTFLRSLFRGILVFIRLSRLVIMTRPILPTKFKALGTMIGLKEQFNKKKSLPWEILLWCFPNWPLSVSPIVPPRWKFRRPCRTYWKWHWSGFEVGVPPLRLWKLVWSKCVTSWSKFGIRSPGRKTQPSVPCRWCRSRLVSCKKSPVTLR